jgi:predicted porin
MKKHLLALAALATVSGVAVAQSATVYGIVDLSVTSISKQGTGSGSNTTALTDAVWMPSVFGITASEDLGGGMKAAVNLESDINADTGSLSGASATLDGASGSTKKLFGRKANVALSGGFGTLTAGKDIDMIFLQGFIDNIRNSHSASGFVANALGGGTSLNRESVFIENMIRYTTPTINGLKASVQYRFGETAGQSGDNNSTAFLVNYNIGALNLNVGHKKINDRVALTGDSFVSGTDQKLDYVGANYTIDKVKIAGTYHKAKTTGGTTAEYETKELGVSYALQPNLSAAVNYVIGETQAGAKSKNTSASLKYSMSKRTSVWGLVSRVNNDAGQDNTVRAVYPLANTVAGSSPTAVSVGVTHSF